jgi:hypothetical protein
MVAASSWEGAGLILRLINRQEDEMTELAYRNTDGVQVSLLWHRLRDLLVVTVDDSRTGESFSIDAPRDRALDVYYHPYAYAGDRLDAIAERGPVLA